MDGIEHATTSSIRSNSLSLPTTKEFKGKKEKKNNTTSLFQKENIFIGMPNYLYREK